MMSYQNDEEPETFEQIVELGPYGAGGYDINDSYYFEDDWIRTILGDDAESSYPITDEDRYQAMRILADNEALGDDSHYPFSPYFKPLFDLPDDVLLNEFNNLSRKYRDEYPAGNDDKIFKIMAIIDAINDGAINPPFVATQTSQPPTVVVQLGRTGAQLGRRGPVSPRRSPVSPRRSPVSPRRSPVSPRRSPISPRRNAISPRRSPVSQRRNVISPRSRVTFSPPSRGTVSPRRGQRQSGLPINLPVSLTNLRVPGGLAIYEVPEDPHHIYLCGSKLNGNKTLAKSIPNFIETNPPKCFAYPKNMLSEVRKVEQAILDNEAAKKARRSQKFVYYS